MKDSLIQKIKSCSRNIALAASSLGLAGILAAQGGCTYGLTPLGPVVLWNDDNKNGIESGPLKYKDGSRYEGEYKFFDSHPIPHGFGKMYDKDKHLIYEGQWERGELHGFGIGVDEDGQFKKGYWDHGRYLGRTKGENEDSKGRAERKDSPQNRDTQILRDPNVYAPW